MRGWKPRYRCDHGDGKARLVQAANTLLNENTVTRLRRVRIQTAEDEYSHRDFRYDITRRWKPSNMSSAHSAEL